jgi:hypothetical protein
MLSSTMNLSHVYGTPITLNRAPSGSRSGSATGSDPVQTMMTLFRMNRTPIEVTSLDRRGALANRRYATSSITALKHPHRPMTMSSTSSIAGTFLAKLLLSSTPAVASREADNTAPLTKT